VQEHDAASSVDQEESRISMRRIAFGMSVAVLGLAGCGSSGTFANKPRPATPVDLTVYIDTARVSVSPASVGAGEVMFIVTNQADKTESLTIHPAGNSARSLATTGPINPQSTGQVAVDLSTGEYLVATASGRRSDATTATRSGIQPAALDIGRKRPASSDSLLQP
jgi:hypothetical protein